MKLYPFILLGTVFLSVLILPPLVAAYIDVKREEALRRWAEARLLADEKNADRDRR